MSITLGSLQKTLLVPLWHRAQVTKARPELLNDPEAVNLVERIDYDFSPFTQRFTPTDSLRSAARTRQFDDAFRAYISAHPYASIVNLGAGLDTAFYRVDSGSVEWYDLDLPDVITLRQRLLPEPKRVRYIAKSLFDTSWCDDIAHTDDGIFIFARGVLWFFEEEQVKHLLSSLADKVPEAELACDACSKLGAPMVTNSLKSVGMTDVAVKWMMGDAQVVTRWDSRLKLIDQTPVYSIPRDSVSEEQNVKHTERGDLVYALSIVHLRV